VRADEALGDRVEHDVERARIREEGSDVLEEDPLRRKSGMSRIFDLA